MNNQAFSKLWIVIILAVLATGVVLVYQPWTPEEILKPSQKTTEEKPIAKETTKPEEVDAKEQITKEMIEEAKNWPGAGQDVTGGALPEIINL